MRKTIVLSLLFVVFAAISHAQTVDSSTTHTQLIVDGVKQVDIVDYLIKFFKIKKSEEKRDNRKVRFSLFPTSSNMSGGKTVFTSFNIAFLLGELKNTNVSTIYFVPYLASGGRFGFQVQPNIWLKENKWNFVGEYFIMKYPQETWGLGGNTPDSNETLVNYNQIRIHQNVLKGLTPNLAVGLGYSYDYHYDISLDDSNWAESVADSTSYSNNTTSSGIVFPIVFGNRRNSLNPQGGFMCNLSYNIFLTELGSNNDWQSLFIDVRKYFPINLKKQRILALRSYYWTVTSNTPPYLDNPANRWEPIAGSSSRGIEQNRYRSNALLYFESEYRFGITRNGLFGGVVFASLTNASQYNSQNFMYWHPATGFGLRVKFNKFSRTNIAIDFAFSKGYQAIYVFIGEVF